MCPDPWFCIHAKRESKKSTSIVPLFQARSQGTAGCTQIVGVRVVLVCRVMHQISCHPPVLPRNLPDTCIIFRQLPHMFLDTRRLTTGYLALGSIETWLCRIARHCSRIGLASLYNIRR
ncbi:hypothetical protein QQP08_020432 [Theobroma cacao]|nr:hypothetical protein QQP08_020432 [Theobroma cacao]